MLALPTENAALGSVVIRPRRRVWVWCRLKQKFGFGPLCEDAEFRPDGDELASPSPDCRRGAREGEERLCEI